MAVNIRRKRSEQMPNDWRILSKAYLLGKKTQMTLQEPESFSNGYIGGDVKWSRFLPVDGPEIGNEKVTGIGQIDYKDCTNAFAVMDGNRRAIAFYSLPQNYQTEILCSILNVVNKSRKVSRGVKM